MKSKNNNTNFWISYADLMAGLLFVFILLIGAIIVKYSLLQSESKTLEQNLKKEKLALEKNRKELVLKEEKLKNILTELKSSESSVKGLKEQLKDKIIENEELKLTVKKDKNLIDKQNRKLQDVQTNLEQYIFTKEELEKKIKLIDEENKQLKNKIVTNEEKLDDLVEEGLTKQKLIELFKEKNSQLEDEIKVILTRLENTQEEHTNLVQQLENTKNKIKSLTGIKVKVITLLKKQLGDNIKIDSKSGNLRLSSNVLFDEGEYLLKEDSKKFLKKAVYDYFQAILDNNEINKHIENIVIEGHTNSKGTFLYNLDLSQKRAYSVMDFLLSLEFEKKEKLKDLVVASGRSYLDPIFNNEGKEDKDASRRIEIKLNIKNEEAIKEISNILR